MSTPRLSDAVPTSPEDEIRALREEVRALRAERFVAADHAELAEEYRLSQLRFRMVFEHSPLGHKIIGPDLGIQQANAALADLLGLDSPLELIGHAILEFAHPDDWAQWAQLQRELWTEHRPWFVLETRLRQPDESYRWCRVTSVLFPGETGELGYTTLEDISERKALEMLEAERTRQAQNANQTLATYNEELHVTNEELQQANAALGRTNSELDTFVYAASHDLRTPLTNLHGLIDALNEQLPAACKQAEEIAPLLGMIQSSLDRFRHVLNRLAEFGTVRQDDDSPREKVVLSAVLEEVRQELMPLLTASGGQLDVELPGNPSLRFVAKHVHSVLVNLISNALKYRHPDRAPVVHVQAFRHGKQVVVRVKDNGLGLSPAQQGQLFHLFRRLHSHVEGTGVGLYLVKKIMENAGGSVQVESELGRGSTFTAVFPG